MASASDEQNAPPGNLADEVAGLPPMKSAPPPALPPAELTRRRSEQLEVLAALEGGELIEIPIVTIEALKPRGGG
jgi:hypothetical protein